MSEVPIRLASNAERSIARLYNLVCPIRLPCSGWLSTRELPIKLKPGRRQTPLFCDPAPLCLVFAVLSYTNLTYCFHFTPIWTEWAERPSLWTRIASESVYLSSRVLTLLRNHQTRGKDFGQSSCCAGYPARTVVDVTYKK